MDQGSHYNRSSPSGSNWNVSSSPLFSQSATPLPVRPEARRPHVEDSAKRVAADESQQKEERTMTVDERTLLLQQAANYASLASLGNSAAITSSSALPSSERVDFGGYSAYQDMQAEEGKAAVAPTTTADNLSKSRLSRSLYRNSRIKEAAPLTPSYSDPDHIDKRNDVEDEYDAPRLSISSAESSGGSEVKTPESINASPPWYNQHQSGGDIEDNKERLHTRERRLFDNEDSSRVDLISSQRQPIDFSPTIPPYPVDLSETATATARRLRNQRLMNATLDLGPEGKEGGWTKTGTGHRDIGSDDIESNPFVIQPSTSSGLTMQSRSSTIRAKRPDALIRLPSAMTDETARPSPPDSSSLPSTAGPTPAATEDNSFGKARDPMENALVTTSGQGLLASSFESGNDLSISTGQRKLTGDGASSTQSTYDEDSSDSKRGVASPDSWRSLLPEHDPFFMSSEDISSATLNRATSFVRPPSSNQRHSLQAKASSIAARHRESLDGAILGSSHYSQNLAGNWIEQDKRRLSSDSSQSYFSLPGPTILAAPSIHASSNASGSLYDLDGSFNSGGSRSAFAPLQYHYNQVSKSFTSPLLTQSGSVDNKDAARSYSMDERQKMKPVMQGSDDGDGSNRTSAAQQAAAAAAYRRHASFSAFDTPSSNLDSLIHPAVTNLYSSLFHADHPDQSRVVGKPVQRPIVSSSSPERMTGQGGKQQSFSSEMSPSSPASSCAMGNEGDRESWPSSRNSIQGWQGDIASATSNLGSLKVLDPSSLDQRLNEGMQQTTLHSDLGSLETKAAATMPGVLSTSSSSVESLPNDGRGLSPDHRYLTTTTTTTLTTTTTTLFSSPGSSRPNLTLNDVGTTASNTIYPNSMSSEQGTAMKIQTPTKWEAPYDVSPLSPSSLPFLESRPAPASTDFHIETHPTHYILKTKLPGFGIDGITLATKHHRQLVIVADKWDENNGGHFERKVTFGHDADLRSTRAKFDGTMLKIIVPRLS